MLGDENPLLRNLPDPATVRDRLGDALREVELLRRLLSLAETAQAYRDTDHARNARAQEVSRAG